MMMRRSLALLSLALPLSSLALLAGCDTFDRLAGPGDLLEVRDDLLEGPGPDEAAYRGLGRSELLACAGTPARTRTLLDGTEQFVYERGDYSRTDDHGYDHGLSGSFSLPLEQEIRSDYCEVRLSLVGGVVSDVLFDATSGVGSRRYRNCRAMLAACRRVGAAPG